MEVTQGIVEHPALGIIESIRLLGYRLVGSKQRLVLPHLGAIIRKLGQAGIIRRSQIVTVDYRIHVRNRRPDTLQPILPFFDGLHQIVPGRLFYGFQQFGDTPAVVSEQLIDCRLDVFCMDTGKSRQAGLLE